MLLQLSELGDEFFVFISRGFSEDDRKKNISRHTKMNRWFRTSDIYVREMFKNPDDTTKSSYAKKVSGSRSRYHSWNFKSINFFNWYNPRNRQCHFTLWKHDFFYTYRRIWQEIYDALPENSMKHWKAVFSPLSNHIKYCSRSL